MIKPPPSPHRPPLPPPHCPHLTSRPTSPHRPPPRALPTRGAAREGGDVEGTRGGAAVGGRERRRAARRSEERPEESFGFLNFGYFWMCLIFWRFVFEFFAFRSRRGHFSRSGPGGLVTKTEQTLPPKGLSGIVGGPRHFSRIFDFSDVFLQFCVFCCTFVRCHDFPQYFHYFVGNIVCWIMICCQKDRKP